MHAWPHGKALKQMLTPHALHVECYAEAHYDGIASSMQSTAARKKEEGLETQKTHHQVW
jgi:hypothetical protein